MVRQIVASHGPAGMARSGEASPGRSWPGPAGTVSCGKDGMVWSGMAGRVWFVRARLGKARTVLARQEWCGRSSPFRRGASGQERRGPADCGQAWRGRVRRGRRGGVGCVRARQGQAGSVRIAGSVRAGHGVDRRVLAGLAWRCMAELGVANVAGPGRNGLVRLTLARQGMAGSAWRRRPGLARRGPARHGRIGWVRLGGAWRGMARQDRHGWWGKASIGTVILAFT